MLRKVFVLSFLILFSSILNVYAGWPKDGWIGVEDLDVPHHLTVLKFSDDHRTLARTEEWLTKTLPSSDKTNLVLGKITFIGEDNEHVQGFNFVGPTGKLYVFESGNGVSLRQNPSEIAERIFRSHLSNLQRVEGLSSGQQQSLIDDSRRIVQISEAHQAQSAPLFEVYDPSISIQQIIMRARLSFNNISPSDPAYYHFQELQKTQLKHDALSTAFQTTQRAVKQDMALANQALMDAQNPQKMEDALKDIGTASQKGVSRLSKEKTKVEGFSSEVISRYWHSEQKFLKFLEDSMEKILSQPVFQNLGFVPRVIVLQLHSRFDICDFCSHVLARALTQPDGILEQFRKAIVSKLGLDPQTSLYFTTSFREERNNAQGHFTVEHSSFNGFEDLDIMKQKPAFPLMYIPNPSE